METWISKVYHSFMNREYVMMNNDSKVIGTAFAVWALIDAKTRQAVNLVNMFGSDLEQIVHEGTNDLSFDKKRIKLSDSSEHSNLRVKFGDIDINQHMNSIRYIEHALDLFSSELYFHHFLNRIEVQYGQETSLNDHLTLVNNRMDDNSICVEFRKESGETVCKIRFYFN
jgi:acyl-ACP thioesterase